MLRGGERLLDIKEATFVAVITVFILFSAWSFVSAVERSILAEPLPAPIQVSMYESECDALFRESSGPAAHLKTGSRRLETERPSRPASSSSGIARPSQAA